MYDAIIGISDFTDLVIENFLEKNRFIMLMASKEYLNKFNSNKMIIKVDIDIKNSQLVKEKVKSAKFNKIVICTDNDMLNLMLAEALGTLGHSNNLYVIFNSKDISNLTSDNYKSIYIDQLMKHCFNEEIL
ncbi:MULTISPECIES: hypothetical protein [unclassified Clostridium]|uniref:hypothetical protein n=1 Tax=unclassified Clostridium TaxID=2614128 RepID=UPI0025BE9957|nr:MULTISPECIES: hypothetical protein [unclassified Clostridium]